MELTPTLVNVAVFGVILISAMLAYGRGLTREAVTLGVWIGAALVALNVYPVLIPVVRDVQDLGDWTKWVALGVAFVVALILFTMLGSAIASLIGRSPFRAIDKGLGFIFGGARGLLILALCWIGYEQIVKPEYTHAAIDSSQGGQLVDDTASWLMSLAPTEWPAFLEGPIAGLMGGGEDAAAGGASETPALTETGDTGTTSN